MTELLGPLFSSGRIVDIILALILAELLALRFYRRATGGGIATMDLVMNNLAGAGLLLALRSALTGTSWIVIATWLAAALIAHVADVARRWDRSGTSLQRPGH